VTLTEIGTSAWCATLNVLEVGFDDEPEAFSNINTREELHTWENAPPA
jgi:molybdopterin-guanine dinucleotide biosynthesis protein A